MRCTEKDHLALVLVDDAAGLQARAKRLLARSRFRRLWRVVRCVETVGLYIMMAALAAVYIVRPTSSGSGSGGAIPWPLLVGVVLAYWLVAGPFMWIEMRLRIEAKLRALRRWRGNRLRDAYVLAVGEQSDADLAEAAAKWRRELAEVRPGVVNPMRSMELATIDPCTRRLAALSHVIFCTAVFVLIARGFDGILAAAGAVGLMLLIATGVLAEMKLRRLVHKYVPVAEALSRCRECQYDLRAGHLVVQDDRVHVRCPECGWSAPVLPDVAAEKAGKRD